MNLVLDAGALLAVDRRSRIVGSVLRLAHQRGQPLVTSAAVVAQVWRDGSRQANLARLLAGARVEPLTPEAGRRAGVLLGHAGCADVVDAHLCSLAAPGDMILTSDPDDLDRLLRARGVDARMLRV